MTKKVLISKERFIEALMLCPFMVRRCSICNAPLCIDVSMNRVLFFDSNCDCVTYTSEPQPRDFCMLDEILQAEESRVIEWIEKVENNAVISKIETTGDEDDN